MEKESQILDLDNLTPEQALKVQAKILGYREMPVDIETFIEDPYYLGNIWGNGKLYPYWKNVLKKIFPTPIHVAYPYRIFTGPIGAGKSIAAIIACAYDLHKLLCLSNFDYFGVNIQKTIDSVFFHQNATKADNILLGPLYNLFEAPFFKEHTELWDLFGFFPDGPRTDAATGQDVIDYHFSEVNFVDEDGAQWKINQAFHRLKSRFIKILGFFGGITIDSSAGEEGSLVEYLIKKYPVQMLVVRDPIWVVKAHLGVYFKTPNAKGQVSFWVYTGDGQREPMIIEDPENLPEGLDPDKLLEVPNELLTDYLSDIYLALQNTAGIGTCTTDTFIQDTKKLQAAFSIPNKIPEIVSVDFYDDDQLIDYIRPQLQLIPEEKIICIGIDMGVSGDLAGFAASYLDDYIYKEGKKTIEFKTVTPLAISIGRKPGQETAITKIFNLIMAINEIRQVGLVVTDQYQSTQLRQDLDRAGIWSYLSSVDRTKEPYTFYKLQVYHGYQSTVNNRGLYQEQHDLIDTGGMIDHSPTGIDRKDCSDAVVNSVYAINCNQEYFMQISTKYSEKLQVQIIDQMATPMAKIQEIINKRRF